MPVKLMSEAKQREVLEAVKEAVALGSDFSPTEALAKVASDHGYNEHILQRMVESYNTGKTLHHMRTATPEEKSASFELADFDEARAILLPDDEKEVKAAHFTDVKPVVFESQIPNFNGGRAKAAAADILKVEGGEPRKAEVDIPGAYRKLSEFKTKARQHRKEAEDARVYLETAVRQLGDNFRQVGHEPNWFGWRKEAEAVSGELAGQLCDYAQDIYGLEAKYDRHKLPKEASAPPVIDDTTDLHKLMKIACVAARIYSREKAAEQRLLKKQAKHREALQSLGKSEAAKKEASIIGLLGIQQLGKQMDATSDSIIGESTKPEVLPEDVASGMNINDELRKARIGIAVRDMMDEDDVISQHASEDPARVTEMVREITRVSPALLDMPIALRAAIRRQLEMGVTEPHELQQLRDFSKKPDEFVAPGVAALHTAKSTVAGR